MDKIDLASFRQNNSTRLELNEFAIYSSVPFPVPSYFLAALETIGKEISTIVPLERKIRIYHLSSQDWGNLDLEYSFGIPFCSKDDKLGENFVCVPAETTKKLMEIWEPVLIPAPSQIIEFYQKLSDSKEYSFDGLVLFFCQLIGFHEIGHWIAKEVDAYLEKAPAVNEMVAQILAYYLLSAHRQELGDFWLRVHDHIVEQRNDEIKYTSLDSMDKIYLGVGMPNYAWYQGRLLQFSLPIFNKRGKNGIVHLLKILRKHINTKSSLPVLKNIVKFFPELPVEFWKSQKS